MLPELQLEFDKMKLRVETALKQKLDSLDEIEKSKQDAIELEKRKEK
jgi:hypothetical protein